MIQSWKFKANIHVKVTTSSYWRMSHFQNMREEQCNIVSIPNKSNSDQNQPKSMKNRVTKKINKKSVWKWYLKVLLQVLFSLSFFSNLQMSSSPLFLLVPKLSKTSLALSSLSRLYPPFSADPTNFLFMQASISFLLRSQIIIWSFNHHHGEVLTSKATRPMQLNMEAAPHL